MRKFGKPQRAWTYSRRAEFVALLAGLIVLGVALLPMPAGAVHNGPFELDGNALDGSASGPPDDWGTLFPTDNSSADLGHSFVTDKTGATDDGFGSGQTKDTADVPNWTAATGAISPEKDDILHAYAATYVDGSNQLLYFGQDRAPKPQGSTSMGFWFFQDKVGPNGSGGFTGKHVNGDVLITSDMTNGGSVSVVNIFRWQNGGLVSVASLSNAECGPSLPAAIEALGCAIANKSGPIAVPWSYPPDSNPNDPRDVPQNIFFEGGINLSNLFAGQAIPCFSSFLASTRTSPSPSADLKDFVAGTIDTCGTITIHKVAIPKSEWPFAFGTSGAGLSDFELSDPTNGKDASQTKVFTGLAPGEYSISELDPFVWTNSDLDCMAEGPNTSAETSGDGAGRTAEITLGLAGNVVCTFLNERKQPPNVSVEKSPDDQTISAGQAATFSITATNNGPGDSNVTLSDDLPAGTGGLDWSVSSDPSDSCSVTPLPAEPQVLSCDFGLLEAGESRTVSVSTATDSADCATLNNTVNITASGDESPEDDSDSGSITVSCPDVSVEKTPDEGSITVGGDATFSIVVTNNGPGSAANVELSDWLPFTPHHWSIASQPAGDPCGIMGQPGTELLSCEFGTLAEGESRTVAVSSPTSTDLCGPMSNTATISASGDTDPENDSDQGSLEVTCPVSPDVSVAKTPDQGTAAAGDTIAFTIKVTNAGPGSATNVVLTDDLPAGFDWQLSGPDAASCLPFTSPTLACDFDILTENASRTVTLSAATDTEDCGLVRNRATVSANDDAKPENNFDSASIAVECGTIRIEKQTNPDGSAAEFEFSGAIDASLTDGESATKTVAPGTYSVTEAAAEGWDLISITCDDPSANSAGDLGTTAADIDVAAGETVVCTFLNEQDANIVVEKQTIPNGDPQEFDFDAQYSEGGFWLADGESSDSGDLRPGAYVVTENVPGGWDLSSIDCGLSEIALMDDGVRVYLEAGQTVTCTFTNTKRGTIVVEKQTNPDGAPDSFSFTGDAAGATSDNGRIVVDDLVPGTYTSTEAAAQGFELTGIACDDADSNGDTQARTATFNVQAGETVTCTFTNTKIAPGTIEVDKTAGSSSVKEPGGPVSFTVAIRNTSAVNVTISDVVDNVFGDLDDDGGSGVFDVPFTLAPGEQQSRTFERQVSGADGDVHTNVVTASGQDENGNPVSDSDDAQVEFTPRLIDLEIVKTANPQTELDGIVNYLLTVTNNGPDAASNVQVADPAPAGIRYLTVNTSKGTCSLTPALVSCALGELAAGEIVRIRVTAQATATGTHRNVATVTNGSRETNPANNVDDAATRVQIVQAKSAVRPARPCLSLTVSPKMIRADGRPDRVSVKVTAGRNRMHGIKVTVAGAGVRASGRSNGTGMAYIRINPRRPGLITITARERNRRVCGAKRIGVAGAFRPPLTG
jgi:uncharacterized repeat protein (TIGR01451 family)